MRSGSCDTVLTATSRNRAEGQSGRIPMEQKSLNLQDQPAAPLRWCAQDTRLPSTYPYYISDREGQHQCTLPVYMLRQCTRYSSNQQLVPRAAIKFNGQPSNTTMLWRTTSVGEFMGLGESSSCGKRLLTVRVLCPCLYRLSRNTYDVLQSHPSVSDLLP